MDEILCTVWGAIAGALVAATLTLIFMEPRLRVGEETVQQCRRLIAGIDAFEACDRDKFWRELENDPSGKKRWAIIKAISMVPID